MSQRDYVSDWLNDSLLPMLGGYGEQVKYRMEEKMARLRHKQQIEEIDRTYKLRGEEAATAHEYDVDILNRQTEIKKLDDVMERNRMLLGSSYNRSEKQYATHQDMAKTKFTEDYQLASKKKEYQAYEAMMTRLSQLKETDPNAYSTMMVDGVNKSLDSLKYLDAQEASIKDSLFAYTRAQGDKDLKPEEKRNCALQVKALTGQLGTITEYKKIVDQHIKSFTLQGATPAGPVPEETKSNLKQHLQILGDKLYYEKIGFEDLQYNQLKALLQESMNSSGGDIEWSPADEAYLQAHFHEIKRSRKR